MLISQSRVEKSYFNPIFILMEEVQVQDILIVGAGIAGLTTSLGLHRLGIRSLVLESSESLRVTGFAFPTWRNAWKALDAVGIGDSLRLQHERICGIQITSTISGLETSELPFMASAKVGDNEVRCVMRNILLDTLSKELPSGTIRYSSKVVSIEESGFFKLVHLADGTIFRTKVLIGCDGVNSVVAKWLGFKKPAFTRRYALRGNALFSDGHGFEPKFMQFSGEGVVSGVVPCDANNAYWYFGWTPSTQEKELEGNPAKMKQFVLSKLGKWSDQMKAVIEKTEVDGFMASSLRYRPPWEVLWGNISKGNVCVAGDALHPMTPDIGQGACSALEDGVVLARCLGESILGVRDKWGGGEGKEEYQRIEMGLKKYGRERRWRSFELIAISYVAGAVTLGDGRLFTFFRDKFFARIVTGLRI